MADVRICLVTCDRGRQDDRAAAIACQDVGNAGLHGLPHSAEVNVDHLLPQCLFGLVQLPCRGTDAGVGDDDVELSELFDATVNGGFQRVEITNIDFGG